MKREEIDGKMYVEVDRSRYTRTVGGKEVYYSEYYGKALPDFDIPERVWEEDEED